MSDQTAWVTYNPTVSVPALPLSDFSEAVEDEIPFEAVLIEAARQVDWKELPPHLSAARDNSAQSRCGDIPEGGTHGDAPQAPEGAA